LTDVLSWVVGRGGLLGRNVEGALSARGRIWYPSEGFEWKDPRRLREQLSVASVEFAKNAGTAPWQLLWCAGAGVVGTGPPELRRETDAFRYLLDAVAAALASDQIGLGAVFVASSAGGLYAGSSRPPYTEHSREAPLAPYGWNKLEQEAIARSWSADHKVPLLIGRISNLYGPGQNLRKNQGLITEVCRRMLVRQPFSLYVPLDTIRDYLFAADCGALVADGLMRLRHEAWSSSHLPAVVKIFASQRPSSVATVLAEIRRVTKQPVRVILAASPSARHQAPDLRMASEVWPELDHRPLTTLGAGVHKVVADLLAKMQLGKLAPSPLPR
jgi:UDP-glucose 4-epimerase